MKPLISVIVPVYNGQDYLSKCINSIEEQTYSPLEIIIINDGSVDQTAEVCRKLACSYENIQIITMNDEGVSAARNAGIDAAKGEYLTFVDADDRLLPPMIQMLYESLMQAQSDIAGCGFEAWSEEGQWRQIENRKEKVDDKPEVHIYSRSSFIAEGILKGNSRCWSKLYKRSVIGDIRFRQGITIGEDMLFLVDLLPAAERIAEISYKGYGYFQNPRGAMNRAFLPKYMDQITCWEIARKKLIHAAEETAEVEAADTEIRGDQLNAQATSVLIMAIMLTAGKLALLSAGDRKKQKHYIEQCHVKLKRELQVPGAYEHLSKGYQIKVKVFSAAPEIYLWLYHFRKYKR